MHKYPLSIPDDLYPLAVEAARADGRSLNNWIVRVAIQGAVLRQALRDKAGPVATSLNRLAGKS